MGAAMGRARRGGGRRREVRSVCALEFQSEWVATHREPRIASVSLSLLSSVVKKGESAGMQGIKLSPQGGALRSSARRCGPFLLALACLALATVADGDDLPTQVAKKRDWAPWKTYYVNGTSAFIPIVGIGGVPVAIGLSSSKSIPLLSFYVDKASYKRTVDVITFDMVMDTNGKQSVLNEDFTIDCATRTFVSPWKQVYAGPMATGNPKWPERKPDMKRPKTSNSAFKAPDLAYFCEGPNHSPLPNAPAVTPE
jgi:hypothetical protein